MFGQVQGQLLTYRVSCHSPKWVSCDGIDLAEGVRVSGNRDSDPPLNDHVPGKNMTAPAVWITWVILEQDFRIRCLKSFTVGSNHILSIPARSHRNRRLMQRPSRQNLSLFASWRFQEWTLDGKMRAPSFLR